MDAHKENLPAMAGDILHFAQAFFLEFRVFLSEKARSTISDLPTPARWRAPPRPQSKFGSCSPERRSPSSLPAAAFLLAASPSRKTLRAGGHRFGSGSKCAATANASRTYMPELYRLIRSLPFVLPFRLPAAFARAASQAAWVHLDLPRTLRSHPRKNLEQSRFPRPIPPNDPQHLPPLHLKRNILQRVDPVRRRSLRSNE